MKKSGSGVGGEKNGVGRGEGTGSSGRAYITNQGSNNVSVIDTSTNTVRATVNVGIAPVAFGSFIK